MPHDNNVRSHDPRNYQLPGRVSLWFRKRGSSDDADWKEFGNVVDPAISAVAESLDHFSQRRGQRAKDRSLISERGATLNFTIDELNLHNLQFAFGNGQDVAEDALVELNESKVFTNPGGGGTLQLEEDLVPDSAIVRNTELEVGDEVTFAAPADYSVDYSTGVLTITPGGVLDDADPDTGVPEVHVFYKKEVEAAKFEMFDGRTIEGEAKFQVLTPGGLQYAAVFSKVAVRNNGDVTIGDGTDWQKVPLQMEILVDQNGELGNMFLIEPDEL